VGQNESSGGGGQKYIKSEYKNKDISVETGDSKQSRGRSDGKMVNPQMGGRVNITGLTDSRLHGATFHKAVSS
jgi:hypothetical protein